MHHNPRLNPLLLALYPRWLACAVANDLILGDRGPLSHVSLNQLLNLSGYWLKSYAECTASSLNQRAALCNFGVLIQTLKIRRKMGQAQFPWVHPLDATNLMHDASRVRGFDDKYCCSIQPRISSKRGCFLSSLHVDAISSQPSGQAQALP
ncbi:hypothetical protein BDV11DRAFT_199391 [Aspergillus similis]